MSKSRSIIASAMLVFGLFSVQFAFAQEGSSEDSLENKKSLDFIFSIGGGVTRYLGDVQDRSDRVTAHVFGNRAAADLNLGLGLSKSFVLNFNAVYGKLSGNENTFGEHRNFQSQMVLGGVNAEYNFAGLYKGRLPVVNPFIVAGAYYSNYFNVSTDIYYNGDSEYYYWSDGKIRDMPETEANQDIAGNIGRDYEYETSLVKGSVHSFTASGGLGIDLHLSRAFSVRLMSRYFFAVTDKVDGFYQGAAAGLSDGYFLNQMSLVVNTSAFSASRRESMNTYKYLFDPAILVEVESEDGDGDGVLDMDDRCAYTPSGIEVDKEGCPLDKDEDGIADYLDIDPKSAKGELVTTKGASLNYELIEDRWINTEGARVISWNKDYSNPRFEKEEGNYAVSFTVEKDKAIEETTLRRKYPKLIRNEMDDSLVVFSVGTYEEFDSAVKESVDANTQSGIEAYVVRPEYAEAVAKELAALVIPDSIVHGHNYGIRESISSVKSSKAYNSAALQMTIAKVEEQLDRQMPESMLVEQYLKGIAPYTWDSSVKSAYVEVNNDMQMHPLPPSEVLVLVDGAADKGDGEKVELPENLVVRVRTSSKSKLNFMPVRKEYVRADVNGDGLISVKEMESMRSAIVSGKGTMKLSEFNLMAERFNDFTENANEVEFGDAQSQFVEKPEYIRTIAKSLSTLKTTDAPEQEASYSVRESINRVKSSKAYNSPLLKKTIAEVEKQLNDQMPESKVVQLYLKALAPYTWDSTVKSDFVEVYDRLQQQPLPESETIAIVEDADTPEFAAKLVADVKPSPQAKLDFMPAPKAFVTADVNGDGLVSLNEVQWMRASVVNGEGKMEVEEFNQLVEQFTDFTENLSTTNSEETAGSYVERPEYASAIVKELAAMESPSSKDLSQNYGVKSSLSQVKSSDAYKSPLLKQIVVELEKQLNREMPESKLVQLYLKALAPYTWDGKVKSAFVEINEKLKLQPVPASESIAIVEDSPASKSKDDSLAEFKPSPKAKLDFMPVRKEFEVADLNGDGLVSSEEIEKVMNSIVEGNGVMEVEEFNRMAARYTDFTENVSPIDFGGTKAAYVDGVLTIFKPQNTDLNTDSRRLLARKYKEGDYNLDGELTPDEVQKIITAFMEGDETYTSDQIHELIDLYFK